MKALARVVVISLTLVALAVGFVGGTAALDITQPAIKNQTESIQFEVKQGDTASSVAQRLQDDGIIRNALVFRLWARYRHLDSGIEQGVYLLSPSLNMDQIIAQLQSGSPVEVVATVPDGDRATQYPYYLAQANLPNFKAADFLSVVKTGVLTDGTKLWQKYWFIPDPTSTPHIYDALEGYLYPSTYYVAPNATVDDVVKRMLDQFGYELCPGPSSSPTLYIYDATQCRQHAQIIDGKNIFDLMRAAYPDAKTDIQALRDAIIIASLTAREINDYKDAPGVAGVYHNRYLHSMNPSKYPADTGLTFGSDPSVEYARDDESPPGDGHWWKGLVGVSGSDVAPHDPYNLYTQPGMPPGPIANPLWDELKAGVNPPNSPYWYFVSNTCGKIIYGKTKAEFNSILVPAMSGGGC
jgi:UPF0755 protein